MHPIVTMFNTRLGGWPYINNGDIIITNGGSILLIIAYASNEPGPRSVGPAILTDYFNPRLPAYGIHICEYWGLAGDGTKIAYETWNNLMDRQQFIEFITNMLW
jgi:hypothetical protein